MQVQSNTGRKAGFFLCVVDLELSRAASLGSYSPLQCLDKMGL